MRNWSPAANEIFLHALELPTPERGDFVHTACGDDSELLAAVESLLTASERAGEFLELPPPLLRSSQSWSPNSEGAGSEIGRYRLVEQIGEGGFGVVYRAEQREPVRRLVALKIIKPGMDTRQVIARFEAERQTLALMQHPHIAQVLDGGATPLGRPYFVMELVEGIPITAYCDRQSLTPRDRLRLFLDVCQAVQHAHLKGIIHRDLKPSNILVTSPDGRAMVKVIDFGVAKAIDQSLTDEKNLTRDAQMVGTPLYMSPEQTQRGGSHIDTRSDIYSLGVVLYELLTSATPFERRRVQSSSFDEVRRILNNEEPPTPSARVDTLGDQLSTIAAQRGVEPAKLGRVLRGDLDWIVMRAMEKEPGRRYQAVAELVDDVEHYLRDEPVSACPPSTTYKFRKLVRRYKTPLTATAIMLVGLFAATGFSIRQAVIASRANELAQQRLLDEVSARAGEASARQQAEHNFRQARAAVDRYFVLVSESTLLDVPGLQPLRKDLLKSAREYYQQFLSERGDDRELQAEIAVSYFHLAQVNHVLDENEEALAALRQGLKTVADLRSSGGDEKVLRDRLAGTYKGGRTLHLGTRQPSDPMSALATLAQTAALWEQFTDADPANPLLKNDLAGLNFFLGDLLRGLRKIDAALQPLQKAADQWESLADQYADVAEYRANLARCQHSLSDVFRRLKRLPEAKAALERSLALRDQLVERFADVPEYRLELALTRNEFGASLAADGAFGEAQRHFDGARPLLERLATEFPAVPIYQESLASHRLAQARLSARIGDMARADAAYRDAIEAFDGLARTYPTLPRYREQFAAYARQYAWLLIDAKRPIEAESTYRAALSNFERLSTDFPNEPQYALLLAKSLTHAPLPQLRDPKRAVAAAQRAVELAPADANCWNVLGSAQLRDDHVEEAIASLSKAAELRKKMSASDGFWLALACAKSNDYEAARKWYERSVDWLNQHPTRSSEILRLRDEAAAALHIETLPIEPSSGSVPRTNAQETQDESQ